jgi:tetratricopeptide (TPR) repeat protein
VRCVLAVTLFLGCQTKEVTSAKVYQQQGNWDKMIEQLEQAVKIYPKDAKPIISWLGLWPEIQLGGTEQQFTINPLPLRRPLRPRLKMNATNIG